jgi:superfamily II DNA/RNA helicase
LTTFSDLGLRGPLVDALANEGITEPFPIQALTIGDALAGRDVCGKARTGSGKTLAFGLPILERTEPGAPPMRPRALVLAPTRELAKQIVDVLAPLAPAAGLRVRSFYGGTAMDKDLKALEKGIDVIIATPGRLIDLVDRKAIRLDDIRMVVVDEADRMADMGFLPQVEWLLRHVGRSQVLLFSATLDGQVDVLVRHHLHDPTRHEVATGDESPHDVAHHFFQVHEMDRVKVAAAICRGAFRTILFVRTKRGADRLATQLKREGVNVEPIHGDLRQGAREHALKQFIDGKLAALVATDVAARGIHVDDIDVVVHFDLPEDHKGFVHRSGRTARAGRGGAVATFVLWNQLLDVEKLQKRLGLREPVVEVFSNDPRLLDLAGASPSSDSEAVAS